MRILRSFAHPLPTTTLRMTWALLCAVTTTAAATDLRLERVRESLTGTHYVYRQYVNGCAVIDGEVHIDETKRTEHLARTDGVNARCEANTVLLNRDGTLHRARREVLTRSAIERYLRYTDLQTGEVLREDPLFYTARARVFDTNPVARLNDPDLRDENDAVTAVSAAAYSDVDLEARATGPLGGPNAQIVDIEPPSRPVTDAAGPLAFDRSQPGFEEVNAYFHIDRAQKYLQSLGYTGSRRVVPYPIPVDAHAASGTDNSYYVAGLETPGQGRLFFGDGGTDDAEDSDLIVHEYTHAIHDWIAPGAFSGSSSSQSRALSEGIADYWSFSAHYDASIASGRDPFCFADWDPRCWTDKPEEQCAYRPDSDCLRRVDSTKTMADFVVSDAAGTEHRNGEIWSSAMREIFLVAGKRITDTLAIESIFSVSPAPTFSTMAQQLLNADRLLYGGAHSETICAAMSRRGILAECDRMPRGELTLFPVEKAGVTIPDSDPNGIVSRIVISDPRLVERVAVAVDIVHAARGDLRITLVAPDGREVVLQSPSRDRTPDMHVTFGIDAQPEQPLDVLGGISAAGEWQLRIVDAQPRDTGTLLSWTLVLQFAGDAPAVVRPSSANRSVIPVAGHANGANGTTFATDLYLFNRGSEDARVGIVYTPSGSNGMTRFAAVNVVVRPGRVVRLRDVAAKTLQSLGIGQLEIHGDVDRVVISSRTYAVSAAGTRGERIPSQDPAAAQQEAIYVPSLESTPERRSNIGFAEVGGAAGTIHVRLFDPTTGGTIDESDHRIEPFGHAQIAASGGPLMIASVSVSEGEARILAYGSVVDNRSGDAEFISGVPLSGPQMLLAPAIAASGPNGVRWQSDLTVTKTAPIEYTDATDLRTRSAIAGGNAPDIVSRAFALDSSRGMLGVAKQENQFATMRIRAGDLGQSVPLRQIDDAPPIQHLVGVESSASYRTNVGIYAVGENAAVAQVALYDSSGAELERRVVRLAPRQLFQFAIGPVVDGRVTVETTSGRVHAYASIIDNVTGDPVFVPGE